MKTLALVLTLAFFGLTSCAAPPTQPTPFDQPPSEPAPLLTATPQANMPNPASVYCEAQGNRIEIRTAADGSQSGVCIFPDERECDEWAYFRGECGPTGRTEPAIAPTVEVTSLAPTEISTAIPIDPADYQQGWWTYTHDAYNFSIMLPEDWVVEETAGSDPLMSGHLLNLHPNYRKENIRLTFRRAGEDFLLWPTGVGSGEFIQQGTLDIAGQPARRILLVCPNGDVTAIWYHNAEEGQPNITRGDMEFGFIYSVGGHCDAGFSLSGKIRRWGEMIIASLKVPQIFKEKQNEYCLPTSTNLQKEGF